MTNSESLSLNSDFFECRVDPRDGIWSLTSSDGQLEVKPSRILCEWRMDSGQRRGNTLEDCVPSETSTNSSPFGMRSAGIRLRSEPGEGIELVTEVVLPEIEPFCFLRVSIENLSDRPIYLERVDFFGSRSRETSSSIREAPPGVHFIHSNKEHLRFFGQGWQGWSYAGVLAPDDVFPRSKLGPLSGPMQMCWGRKHPSNPGKFLADFYGVLVDIEKSKGIIAGFLSQRQAFGRVEADLKIVRGMTRLWQDLESVRLPSGESFSTDWSCLSVCDLREAEPLSPYLEIVAYLHGIDALKSPVSGWCSWYCFGQDISEDRMKRQLGWLAQNRDHVPLGLFQIDDGYQQSLGDWNCDPDRFPESLNQITDTVHSHDLNAGIWLAPLITLPGSDLAKQHPDWLLRGDRGRVVNAGYGWGRFFNPLDGTHPDVKEAIRKWVDRMIGEWGFDYLKLDFLYAGALAGVRYDDTKTGAMVLRDVLRDIRNVAGDDVFIGGCGCPLGSGLGLVDSMRISPDVSEYWKGRYKGISILVGDDPGFPSAWNAIRNSYYRAHQHGNWWLNDPDCLILREDGSALNEAEVRSLSTMVALSGGVVIDSDSLLELPGDRVEMLARLLPPVNRRPAQPTLFDPEKPPLLLHKFSEALGEWSLTAVFNFSNTAKELVIDSELLGYRPGENLFGFDYWDHQIRRFRGDRWELGIVPAHGVALWSFRKPSGGAQWIGDTIHISQGLCVRTWKSQRQHLRAEIHSGRSGKETVWLYIPGKVCAASIDDKPISSGRADEGIVPFEIQLGGRNVLDVEWD